MMETTFNINGKKITVTPTPVTVDPTPITVEAPIMDLAPVAEALAHMSSAFTAEQAETRAAITTAMKAAPRRRKEVRYDGKGRIVEVTEHEIEE